MSDLNKENIIPPYFYFNTKYAEWFEDLNNEQAGQAIKSICSYVTLKESPKAEDPAVKIVVTAMKQDIDKSFKKYRAQCENGKKGGAPKGNKNAAKKTDNIKGTFLSLPIDDIGDSVTSAYYDVILWEAKKTSFDIQKHYNSSQLVDLIAIYSVDRIDEFKDFCTEYESLKDLTFNTTTNKALKLLKEIQCESYKGAKPFSNAFAEYKQRAFDFLELSDLERKKYNIACNWASDPDFYTPEEVEKIKNLFSSSEFEKLESLVKNNPKTTQNNQM